MLAGLRTTAEKITFKLSQPGDYTHSYKLETGRQTLASAGFHLPLGDDISLVIFFHQNQKYNNFPCTSKPHILILFLSLSHSLSKNSLKIY